MRNKKAFRNLVFGVNFYKLDGIKLAKLKFFFVPFNLGGKIVTTSMKKRNKLGVLGALCFYGDFFISVIEIKSHSCSRYRKLFKYNLINPKFFKEFFYRSLILAPAFSIPVY